MDDLVAPLGRMKPYWTSTVLRPYGYLMIDQNYVIIPSIHDVFVSFRGVGSAFVCINFKHEINKHIHGIDYH